MLLSVTIFANGRVFRVVLWRPHEIIDDSADRRGSITCIVSRLGCTRLPIICEVLVCVIVTVVYHAIFIHFKQVHLWIISATPLAVPNGASFRSRNILISYDLIGLSLEAGATIHFILYEVSLFLLGLLLLFFVSMFF